MAVIDVRFTEMNRIPLWLLSALAGVALASCAKQGGGDESDKKISALQTRIAALENRQKSFAKMEKFLKPIMAKQQEQEDQKAEQEPDPKARFNVNIAGSYFDGPETAVVTIVEAFDFA